MYDFSSLLTGLLGSRVDDTVVVVLLLLQLQGLWMILSSVVSSLFSADEFIKGRPEVQSLAVRVEGSAAEPKWS